MRKPWAYFFELGIDGVARYIVKPSERKVLLWNKWLDNAVMSGHKEDTINDSHSRNVAKTENIVFVTLAMLSGLDKYERVPLIHSTSEIISLQCQKIKIELYLSTILY